MNIPVGFLVVLTHFISCHAGEDFVVQLPKGKIRGHTLKSDGGKTFYGFQEIPYAAPPNGTNRFMLPKEPKPWSDILDTTKNTVVCYQQLVRHDNLKASEDCLYINVYTPVPPGTTESLPVLFWIHGGGFAGESGTIEYFGPKYFMDFDVVVVTFNYRLGPFGFLTTANDVMPANVGLKDQLFALEWVQENIGQFGGNKSRVTIAGESAGSMAAGLHLLGPWENNKILFHGAILQSGSALFFTRSNKIKELAFSVGQAVNFSSNDSKALLDVLQNASAADILYAASKERINWPIIEKDGPFKYQMYETLEKGNFKKVPIMIGFNSEEWLEYDGFNPNLKDAAKRYDEDPSTLFDFEFKLSSENRTAAGKLLKNIYTNTTFEDNIGALIRYDSDNYICTSVTKQAELQSKYADVYFYQFSYKGPLGQKTNLPKITGCESVTHTEELNYMWDGGFNSELSKYPDADRLMLNRMIKLWTNFIKYQNPTPVTDAFLLDLKWPKVDPNQPYNIQYLNINSTFEIATNPRYYQKIKTVFDTYITSNNIA